MSVNSPQNILALLCAQPCDSRELEQVLLGRFGSSSGDKYDPKALLFPGHQDRYAIKLVFNRRHELEAAFGGPLLNDSELSELSAQVERELLTPGKWRIGTRILFAALPVTGTFRLEDDFQILPVPENAPTPPFLLADHPFLLQFRFRWKRQSNSRANASPFACKRS